MPFQMAITPVQQFQKEAMFCTPGIDASNGFSENDINFVYELDSTGKMPDDMMLSNVVNGVDHWKQIDTLYPSADYQFIVPFNSTHYLLVEQFKLANFAFRTKTNKPFAAYAMVFPRVMLMDIR